MLSTYFSPHDNVTCSVILRYSQANIIEYLFILLLTGLQCTKRWKIVSVFCQQNSHNLSPTLCILDNHGNQYLGRNFILKVPKNISFKISIISFHLSCTNVFCILFPRSLSWINFVGTITSYIRLYPLFSFNKYCIYTLHLKSCLDKMHVNLLSFIWFFQYSWSLLIKVRISAS